MSPFEIQGPVPFLMSLSKEYLVSVLTLTLIGSGKPFIFSLTENARRLVASVFEHEAFD
jgi:hypothetical protein